ncbi:MAG: pantoate--beta-alanine ligase [Pseudomonadota bacterium]
MHIVTNIDDIKPFLDEIAAKALVFVPTMGALHQGHLSLIEKARQFSPNVVVSIFVNPAQFAAHEDFETYPQTLEQDLELLRKSQVKGVFIPKRSQIYGQKNSTTISVGSMAQQYCGRTRPQHFDGVCLVVVKLFNLFKPDYAVFGEKDFQQLSIIKKIVNELNIDVKIVGCPTVREKSGVALSSRNLRLSKTQMQIAPQLYRRLCDLAKMLQSGMAFKKARAQICLTLRKDGFDKIEYLELINEDTLQSTRHLDATSRLIAAAYLGQVRLIDNIKI